MAGDQHRFQLVLVCGASGADLAAGDQRRDLDHRDEQPVELGKQPVLTLGQAVGQLLERVDRLPVAHEADDMPGNPPRDIDKALVAPRLERKIPWQVEEIRVPGTPAHLEVHSLRDHSPRL